MFVALVLVCGLNPAYYTEGCLIRSYSKPLRSKPECAVVLMDLKYLVGEKLPKGAYIANSGCQTLGRLS